MPILIEQYEWSESATEVTLSLPLKGVKPSTVDIISTESYLKVSTHSTWLEFGLFTWTTPRAKGEKPQIWGTSRGRSPEPTGAWVAIAPGYAPGGH